VLISFVLCVISY